MIKQSQQLSHILENFKRIREQRGLSTTRIEEILLLGPGWLESIESGAVSISIEMLLSLLKASDILVSDLIAGVPEENDQQFPRNIYAEQSETDIIVRFKYAAYDAEYQLPNATIDQFNQITKVLRDKLAQLVNADGVSKETIKTKAVVGAFESAIELWPNANPSDVWWFIVYRAYLDPFNHPAAFSRLNFEQSWKRTGGWALEEILVRHYATALKNKGINLFIASTDRRDELLSQAKTVEHRLEADKADVILTGDTPEGEVFFGIVHVKASFAERRTDDVPMSKALVDAGYISPLWTMDCKSMPNVKPSNKGELGKVKPAVGKDTRSAKRKDIEDDAFFSACFSYNKNTKPTPNEQVANARIIVCGFANAETDAFHTFIVSEWERFQAENISVL